jgi:tRNA nucleotidyltransferase (CCA-adding enzyme)
MSIGMSMNVYLVGGAVRDELLGLEVTERDWVVVGSNPDELESLGFQQVGKDFPVFLHPSSGEEYALARTERKTGVGHKGFDTETEGGVTLEQDLLRRDLTINAIARDENGKLIDPYNGQDDLSNGILRHVSPAFAEDPLRILRVARFAARFKGFSVHQTTDTLMREMVARNALDELPPERVFRETEKALSTDCPAVYFQVLSSIDAEQSLWPEIGQNNIKELAAWHADGVPLHAFIVLTAGLSEDALTTLNDRLRLPSQYHEMARMAVRFYPRWQSARSLPASVVVDALYEMDVYRRPKRFETLCTILMQVAQSRGDTPQQTDLWNEFSNATAAVSAGAFPSVSGPALGQAIKRARIVAVESLQ